MVVVPLSKSAAGSDPAPRTCAGSSFNWVALAAAGTLVTSGALLFCGKRRAGLVTAASGTALTMLDQQEMVRSWWNALPAYVAEIQSMLTRVQTTLDDISAQRERLHKLVAK
jgi:hypothetical protein